MIPMYGQMTWINSSPKESPLDDFLGKFTSSLKSWTSRVKDIRESLYKEAEDIKSDLNDQLEAFKIKESELKEKIGEMRKAGEKGFESMKEDAQSIWDEMSLLIDSIEGKKQQDKKGKTYEPRT